MAAQNHMDQFEAFFRRADLDGDGRISGAEAVAFFQGSNLPKPVLAQIWTHADQSRSGFLGRAEFYNALKLVTVAQSKRDLTPEIVKAALYGPAAAKIPPPQINLTAIPGNQVNSIAAAGAPRPQMGAVPQMAATQNPGFRGPGGANQQYFNPSQQSQMMRPTHTQSSISQGPASYPHQGGSMMAPGQAMQPSGISRPPQFMPGGITAGSGVSNPNIAADWPGGRSGGTMSAPRGVTPSASNTTLLTQNQALVSSQPQSLALVPSQPQNVAPVSSQPAASDSKALVVSGNGFANDSFFGSDVFSATPSNKKPEQPSVPSYSGTSGGQPPSKSNSLDSLLSAMSKPASPTTVPASSGAQLPVKSNSLDSLRSAYATQPLGSQLEQAQQVATSGQQVTAPSSSSPSPSGTSVGVGNASDSSQILWPKMKPSDIQKYTKVFMEVDSDRDGRITGEQARNLFLSWRLPREVLKQVWDLSDQDSDSMLSLREFCFALYLMERYREGRPLPAALPNNVMYDETLLSMTGQPKGPYGNASWGHSPGFGQQPGMGTRPMGPAGMRPPVPVTASQRDAVIAPNQQKSRAPVLGDFFLNQSVGEQNSENSIRLDGLDSEKKPGEPEKVILDSKEKIEYYRSKMQDLVLYKSRCDNRLNEITERAIADKREAESLGKKYEEKYKQVAEMASKLTIEEATLRDIQERKLELHQAIVNMEKGGSADGILQVRADRIQSDLDELMKALIERSKKHGLEIKSAAMIELPIGWQPGFQESAATWDEDWDKFEDEGFSNDLTLDVTNVSGSKSTTIQKERASEDGSRTPDSLSNGDGKSRNFLSPHESGLESESAHTHSEDELTRSPQESPAGKAALGSPSGEFSDVFAKSTEADTEIHRSFDESTWGAFDTNDDVDSVWGFNPASNKDSDSGKDGGFFGSDDFGVKPIRTEPTSTKSPFFEDSVAGSPMSRFGNSPRYSEAGDHFDNFSRFDSFSMHEGGFSPREKLTRFDSVNSSKDFGSRAFSSFDDTDPFGSSGPFKVSLDGQTPKKDSEKWGNF